MTETVELDLHNDLVAIDHANESIALDLVGQAVELAGGPDAPPVALDLAATAGVELTYSTDTEEVMLQATTETIALALSDVDINLDATAAPAIELDFGSGLPGPPGPEGPPGTASSTYAHSQASAASVWTITHALGYRPNVTVADSAGTVLYADVIYVDDVTIEITHSWPTAGYAYLS
jgi:hypothetical protein